MTTVVTRGAASAQALGYASSSAAVNYIEDVFSTYLYTGNGSTQTITNGIDLTGKGGLVWFKNRSAGSTGQMWYDTARGAYKAIQSDTTQSEQNYSPDGLSAFTSSGFSLNGSSDYWNISGNNFASWTFRKQPKFFDIVTYTGTDSQQSINHNLGSVPGCIIVKRTDATSSYWGVYHRSSTDGYALGLNTTEAQFNAPSFFVNSASQTSTQFTVGTSGNVNASGGTYVAYLFAHNAGGFGLTGTDNVVSCGSYTGNGVNPGPAINLGYEPQFIIVKNTTSAVDWFMYDTMRGMPVSDVNTGSTKLLRPNTSAAEQGGNTISPTATGFQINTTAAGANTTGDNYIYIAIRRGPMKVPTDATKVFAPVAYTGTGANDRQIGASTFVVDYILGSKRNTIDGKYFYTRLQGNGAYLSSTNTNAEAGAGSTLYGPQYGKIQLGYQQGSNDGLNLDNSGDTFINYLFRRAPGFFDEVCYTGTGVARTVAHNLAAVPELMIIKERSSGFNWTVKRNASLDYAVLNSTQAFAGGVEAALWNSTEPTSSVFSLGTNASVNGSGYTYVAYLFASAPGVSKVGSYIGTGTTQQINCGFTAGARFVLIKRTDSTGDWYVWDSARGIVAGNDPHLSLNTTAAEVTTDDSVDTDSAGFVVNQNAATNINVTSASYIFLAVS